MLQRVSLLESDVSAPVADLDIALELGNVADRLGELESHRSGGDGAGGLLVEGTVRELGALLLGELGDVAAAGNLGVVGDRDGSGLDLGLLLRGRIRGLSVDRELVAEVLAAVLLDRRGERRVGLEVIE